MNVVMISIDNLRFDCVGYQPDKRELEKFDVLKYLDTPTLDEIAGKSLCFTQCISTNTYTTSSHASIFTGLYPPRHGVRPFYSTKLSDGVMSIAETLKKNGYKTILYSDAPDLFYPIGLDRGFDFSLSRVDENLFSLLRNWGSSSPVFLFVHFFDVHEPFLHNTNDFRPNSNDDYIGEMRELYHRYDLLKHFSNSLDAVSLWNKLVRGPLADRPIDVLLPLYVRGVTKFDRGRFRFFIAALKEIGFLDGSLSAILSDHGEGRCLLHDKTYLSHGGDLYDNVLRVPLMISHPYVTPAVENKLLSTVDIAPTIMSLLNIDFQESLDGVNILNSERETAYSETWASAGSAAYASADGRIITDSGKWPEFMLTQKAARTTTAKFIMRNKGNSEAFLNGTATNLPDSKYVKMLYRNILGRFEDPEGCEHHLTALSQGLRTRQDMLYDFLTSEEFKTVPALVAYALLEDPEEDRPLPINPFSGENYRYFDDMQALEQKSVQSKPFHVDSQETAEKIALINIDAKEAKAASIIKEAVERYGVEHIGVAWTGGKDSTTVLHLIRQVFDGSIPFKVINIDTSVKFPEIYEFRDKLKNAWALDLRIVKNDDAAKWLRESRDHAECCYQLKTLPLNRAIEKFGLTALITGVRKDEQEARSEETYFSPRENPAHVRVHPILHFTELDIWQYIKKYNIPYCELYNKGYRSLGCAPCTNLSSGTGPERGGREQDKEKIMARLRELGYF